MDNLSLAIFLGVVEGLTEFIPVSSTGHLILFIDLLNFNGPKGKVFEIVIQLGAIFAVCWLYRAKLINVASTFNKDKQSRQFCYNILIAFLPAALIGASLHQFIKDVLFSPLVVSIALIVGGVIILIIENCNIKPKHHDINKISYKTALYIGFAQTLAMIPGTSRSGATIMGSLLLGLDRKAATEFSFFLAIPTMLGATVFDLYKNYNNLTDEGFLIILVGFISAFIAALFVVSRVIEFISNHGFKPFAWYRIILGTVMLFILL